jgi:hypothetical protein
MVLRPTWISIEFGVDYRHQSESTMEIPAAMQERLQAELTESSSGALRKVAVELSAAASSSLDYTVLADFEGRSAPLHDQLQRAIPRILVDLCSERGWVIPFSQLTLHGAGAEADVLPLAIGGDSLARLPLSHKEGR